MTFPNTLEKTIHNHRLSGDFILVYPQRYIYVKDINEIRCIMNTKVKSIRFNNGKVYIILDN